MFQCCIHPAPFKDQDGQGGIEHPSYANDENKHEDNNNERNHEYHTNHENVKSSGSS